MIYTGKLLAELRMAVPTSQSKSKSNCQQWSECNYI